MINIIEQEIEFDELLVLRLNVICDFCNVTLTILNGSLRILKRTNIIL
jgi:hypothetical protein